ncbi:MAG: CoA pyrophosphatase [Deltaproteobacteria bacterium]|jgi:8-oxo-dGTP pyrophosphatase MutT (NUDIX family)|nr:CoA pyrophosphatase [Deltaproteobacteria bacterium]
MEKEDLLKDVPRLVGHIQEVLQKRSIGESLFPQGVLSSNEASAVLFLISWKCPDSSQTIDPCIVLNKRSKLVKQPGDLCFPGGAISHGFDSKLARFMRLPFFPLYRWPYWRKWQKDRPRQARRLSLLFATGIRESFEEMMLNPLGLRFLGPLPPQRLVMFRREIFPFVGWIQSQRHFFINREVEKIVHIPLRELLKKENYARYKLLFNLPGGSAKSGAYQYFPCFRHHSMTGTDVLWGATYRIIMVFLDLVFDFEAPQMERLNAVNGVIDETYYRNNS